MVVGSLHRGGTGFAPLLTASWIASNLIYSHAAEHDFHSDTSTASFTFGITVQHETVICDGH